MKRNIQRPLWMGIRGVYHIWNGSWSDPEVEYKGHRCNEWDLQESMYTYMKERIADGEDWGDPDNDNDFANFCRKHADMVKSDIIDFSEAMYESKNIMLRKDKALLESLTKRYGKNNILNELKNKNKVNEAAGHMPTRFDNPDAWFDNTSFQELEELTGYYIQDFYLEFEDDTEAEEEFIAACEDWWNKHTPMEKRKIYNDFYLNA